MNFEMENTSLPEVKIIRGKRFHDNRGFFSEIYKISEFKDLGLPTFVQDNMSKSQKGVIRGMHWQEEPYGQGKLVQCISGSILDVAVDIRKSSKNYGKHFSIELTANNPIYLWIPEGFAHGFQALNDNTLVSYKVTNYWNEKFERSIRYDSLNIRWPIEAAIVSEKDALSEMLTL